MIKYVVVNENTLGYIIPETPHTLNIFRASILRGAVASYNQCGYITLSPRDKIRPATIEDFKTYRVSPKGHITP